MKKKLRLILFTVFVPSVLFAQGTLTLGIQGSANIVCPGTAVTLYAIGATSGFSWQPGGSTSQYITVHPTEPTTYTLTAGGHSASYRVDVCGDENCETPVATFEPLSLSTGNNGLTTVLGYGQNDLNWTYSTTLNGTYLPTVVSDNSHIPGNYSRSQWPNAQWIGANAGLSTVSNTYYYRLQFSLTADQVEDLSLSMQFMADNTVMGVSVNGVLVPNSATPGLTDYGFQFSNVAGATMEGNWVVGLNTITVQVLDEGGYSGFIGQLNPSLKVPAQDVACLSPLPIKFIGLQGRPVSGSVWLAWQVVMDNMSYFVIERSKDGVSFNPIGTQDLKDVVQNNMFASYQFTDEERSEGINYYRIRAYELTGEISYSKIIVVANDQAVSLQAAPNPGTGLFTLSGTWTENEINKSIYVFNMLGERIVTVPVQTEENYFTTSVDLSHLPAGIYLAKLGYGDSVIKLVKE